MKEAIYRALCALGVKSPPNILHGAEGIRQVGHRQYVGGMWDEIGKLQFDYLISEGLRPADPLLDIACGSLRAGRWLIPYLNTGNYLGIDKEAALIEAGQEHEVPARLLHTKKPEFVVSDRFEFQLFSKRPHVAIAQSLFTHLPPDPINECFVRLRSAIVPFGAFYATFFVSERESTNPSESHDHRNFYYTRDEIRAFGERNGWCCASIAEWGHPRGQQIAKYTLI